MASQLIIECSYKTNIGLLNHFTQGIAECTSVSLAHYTWPVCYMQSGTSSKLLLDVVYNGVRVQLPGCQIAEGATCTLEAFEVGLFAAW